MSDNQFIEMLKQNFRKVSGDSVKETYLIAGLGNPGKDYAGNRHNVGFMSVDHLISAMNAQGKRIKSKAIVSEGLMNGCKIFLVKPQTFMNLSGDAVTALLRFYKVPEDRLMVIHDDIDLPFGTIRIRPTGGAGGQKGVASIIQKLGTPNFVRVRIGVGRPPGRMDPADYVLRDFSKVERDELPFLFSTVEKAVQAWVTDGIEIAMNRFNGEINKDG